MNTETETQLYTYTHNDPVIATNYYRIKMNEENGETSFSETIPVTVKASSATSVSLWPNPAADHIRISAKNNSYKLKIRIIDLAGRIHLEKQLQDDESTVNISSLNTGMYIVNIISDNRGD